tara:strand:+ start:10513 stop:11934 length:1422 start_codon:yes stop_codon:yes gene_type:complete
MKKKLLLLFLIAFCLKFSQVYWLKKLSESQVPQRSRSILAFSSGDTQSYLNPFKNLLKNGTYYEKKPAGNIAFAGRLPMYGIVYYVLKPFLLEGSIYDLYVILAVILEALAILLLSITVYKYYWKTKLGFYTTYIIMILSTYSTSYSYHLSPESIGLSVLIFMLYHYHNLIYNYHIKYAIYLSVFLPILVGLKPYMGAIGLFVSIGVVIRYKYDFKKIIFSNMIIWAILSVLIGGWTYRNYKLTNKMIPLVEKNSGYFIKESHIYLRKFIAVMGESNEPWDKKAMGSYFFSYTGSLYNVEDIPKTTYYNNDSIEVIKNYLSQLTPDNFSMTEDDLIIEKIKRYTNSYKKENKLFTSFIAPFFMIKKFLFHSGSFYLPIDLNSKQITSFQVIFKYFQSVFYYFILIFGFAGLFIKRHYFLMTVPVFLIILFIWIFYIVELRYFLYAYPSLIIGVSVLCKETYNRFLKTYLQFDN